MSGAAAIAVLRDAYPRADFPDRTVELYARMLSDLPDHELMQAVAALIRRSTFLPSIAEIRREVAEARTNMPTAAEAWEIVLRGGLRAAPEEVRRAANIVGGRYTIMQSERPETVRAQFTKAYNELRDQSLALAVAESPRAELPGGEVVSLAEHRLAEIPYTDRIRPRPVMAREAARLAGQPLGPPTDEEKRDAIAILREGAQIADDEHPTEDYLYTAAERIFAEAGE